MCPQRGRIAIAPPGPFPRQTRPATAASQSSIRCSAQVNPPKTPVDDLTERIAALRPSARPPAAALYRPTSLVQQQAIRREPYGPPVDAVHRELTQMISVRIPAIAAGMSSRVTIIIS